MGMPNEFVTCCDIVVNLIVTIGRLTALLVESCKD